ncbi:MAG: hypothetical protein ABN485_13310, partial [Pantoea agglomerans]
NASPTVVLPQPRAPIKKMGSDIRAVPPPDRAMRLHGELINATHNNWKLLWPLPVRHDLRIFVP